MKSNCKSADAENAALAFTNDINCIQRKSGRSPQTPFLHLLDTSFRPKLRGQRGLVAGNTKHLARGGSVRSSTAQRQRATPANTALAFSNDIYCVRKKRRRGTEHTAPAFIRITSNCIHFPQTCSSAGVQTKPRNQLPGCGNLAEILSCSLRNAILSCSQSIGVRVARPSPNHWIGARIALTSSISQGCRRSNCPHHLHHDLRHAPDVRHRAPEEDLGERRLLPPLGKRRPARPRLLCETRHVGPQAESIAV